MDKFLKDKDGDCAFLQINQTSPGSFIVNLEIAYAPNTDEINKIMKIVEVTLVR